MLKLRPSIFALLLGACVVPALSSSAWAQTCACAGAGIQADVAPPALPDYDQPPLPEPGYMWTPGYWAWNTYDYYWVPGTWVEPPQPGLLWTPGYWGFVDGVYAFNRGYWGPHVGFYGGVYYGFGYGGVGYEGGHWENGAFFYNRTVNKFGSVHIENVYEKTVTINAGASRASFNGPGGAIAKPTPDEDAAAKETHLPPTDRQVDHARAASMKSEAFVSTNHGKPTIAATGKPGAFTGASVVKAKTAGSASGQPGGETPAAAGPKAEEKKAPAGGELKPEPKATPTGEPKVGEKPKAEGKPKAERTPKAEPTPRVEETPKAEEKPKAEGAPKAEEKGPAAINKPAAHPTPAKPSCGKPDEPKCP